MSDEEPDTYEMSERILSIIPHFHRTFGLYIERNRLEAGICNKNQEKALLVLRDNDGMIASRLGACLNLQRGSLTSLVDGLVDMGFVMKSPDADDRRKAHLELTPEGRSYIDERHDSLRARIGESLLALSRSERREFGQGLEALLEAFKRIEAREEKND
ncbi:MAG: MarR family transcriptional regulator [Spirochaetes bacterium]|nr:MarR family transcriptional regulator [Spirochaetota bacterium]MBU1080601.1 MarR family transcriptional regulator [Spirochaetota bacterium]